PKIACDYSVRMAATSLGWRSRDKTRSTRQVICENHPRSVLWTFVERVDGIREVQSDANGLRRCTSMNDAQVGTRSRALVHEHKDVVGTSKRGNINQLVAVQVYQLRQSPRPLQSSWIDRKRDLTGKSSVPSPEPDFQRSALWKSV